MNRLFSSMATLGIGAGLMYFLDPVNGLRRRALVRDQLNRTVRKSDVAIDKTSRDLRNRAKGVLYETSAWLRGEQVADWIMEERIRSKLGAWVSRPRGIDVRVEEGRATLTGSVLQDEIEHLVANIGAMSGISGIEDQLQTFQNAADIPELKGQLPREDPGEDGLSQWSPTARLLSGLGAAILFLYGRGRKDLAGTVLSLTGAGLAFRSVTNMGLTRLLGMTDSPDTIRVAKSIQVNAPVDQVFTLWANYQNFPRFMENIQEIHQIDSERSHWIAKGPAGVPVEWDAITTQFVPNEVIAWESLPDSTVRTRGHVRFRPIPDGGTQVNINLYYSPPAGAVGHAVASLFGVNPKQAMDQDLARMKSILETAATSTGGVERGV